MFAWRGSAAGAAARVDLAFTDRWGGVSSGPAATLDLSRERPGAADELAENSARVAQALACSDWVDMRQVHGCDVVVVEEVPAAAPRCDALVTTTSDLVLCARGADCYPVLLADPDAAVVAAAHVGRRGVTAGVVPAAVSAMRRLGATRISAWLGPGICAGCYEVPADLRAEVAAVEPAGYACTTQGRPSVDIAAAVTAQLEHAGCGPVTALGRCTREQEDLFSYRRQGGASGRQAGLVVLRRSRPEGSSR